MPSSRSRLYLAVILAMLLSFGALAPIIYGFVYKKSQTHEPSKQLSFMIGKKLPVFELKDHDGNILTQDSFAKGRYVLNIFASWCTACVYDHQAWAFIKDRVPGAQIIGVAWSDKKIETLHWLTQYGNPYSVVLDDNQGELAIALGVKGAPETFLIENGIIVKFISGIARKSDIIEDVIPFLSEQ